MGLLTGSAAPGGGRRAGRAVGGARGLGAGLRVGRGFVRWVWPPRSPAPLRPTQSVQSPPRYAPPTALGVAHVCQVLAQDWQVVGAEPGRGVAPHHLLELQEERAGSGVGGAKPRPHSRFALSPTPTTSPTPFRATPPSPQAPPPRLPPPHHPPPPALKLRPSLGHAPSRPRPPQAPPTCGRSGGGRALSSRCRHS